MALKYFIRQGWKMPNIAQDALFSGEILAFAASRGVLSIKGPDARNFLQRMSTNDLTKVKADNLIQTSFINNKGRMIDHACVIAQDAESFIIISSYDQGKMLWDWLEQFHFVEDFSLEDLSHEASCYFLFSQSRPSLPGCHKIWQAKVNNLNIDVFLTQKLTIKNAIVIDRNDYETLRIACLMPGLNEINDTNMPQNINLVSFIAHDKGCYIGQEIVAKAITYQKRVKTLCGTYLAKDDLNVAKKGMQVISSDQEIGMLSSIAPLYIDGFINALVISDVSLKSPPPFEKNILVSNSPFILRNPNNLL